MTITPEQADFLDANEAQLPVIWCELNRWKWFPGLGPEPPRDSLALNNPRHAVMDAIVERVGERAVSRCWNIGMSDAAFAAYWRAHETGTLEEWAHRRAWVIADEARRARRPLESGGASLEPETPGA